MRHVVTAVWVFVLACLGVAAQGQAQGRIQRDVKTVAPMYVAFVERASPPDQIPIEADEALTELWTSCEDNGYHPLDVGIITIAGVMSPAPADNLKWEAWLPIIEQPTDEELRQDAAPRVKRVPRSEVAFTYHVGDPNDIENTLMGLFAWAGGKGLTLTGRARVLMIGMTGAANRPEFLAECQLELAQPGQ
jgi:effector-binding domain-containing protein